MERNLFKAFGSLSGTVMGPKLLLPIGIVVGVSGFLLVLRGIAFQLLNRNKGREAEELTLLSVIRVPSIYWCVAAGLYTGMALSDLGGLDLHRLYRFVHVILILSGTLAAANVSASLFKNVMQTADQSKRTSGLAVGVVKGLINGIGILVALSVLGISIAPILTALGVGGLAVALALKDTLENLFAGLYLLTDKAIRVGDVVKIESGQEGAVEDIGWRTIRIRTFNNNTVILPNSKLAQSIVTNYSLPDKRVSVSISILVGHGADIQKVEELLQETAQRGSEEISGVLASPAPSVRFSPGCSEDSLGFSVSFHVSEFQQQSFAQHELRKRIYRRFLDESIPLPKRALGFVAPAGRA